MKDKLLILGATVLAAVAVTAASTAVDTALAAKAVEKKPEEKATTGNDEIDKAVQQTVDAINNLSKVAAQEGTKIPQFTVIK